MSRPPNRGNGRAGSGPAGGAGRGPRAPYPPGRGGGGVPCLVLIAAPLVAVLVALGPLLLRT